MNSTPRSRHTPQPIHPLPNHYQTTTKPNRPPTTHHPTTSEHKQNQQQRTGQRTPVRLRNCLVHGPAGHVEHVAHLQRHVQDGGADGVLLGVVGFDCGDGGWWCVWTVELGWVDGGFGAMPNGFHRLLIYHQPHPIKKTHLRQVPAGLVREREGAHRLVEPPALAALRLHDEYLHRVRVRREPLRPLRGQVGVGPWVWWLVGVEGGLWTPVNESTEPNDTTPQARAPTHRRGSRPAPPAPPRAASSCPPTAAAG